MKNRQGPIYFSLETKSTLDHQNRDYGSIKEIHSFAFYAYIE